MEIRSKFKIKDRSRFTSSVIVSLLAGFICFQFGNEIQEKIVSSVKAISSNSLNEMYGPEYCGSFNSLVNRSDKKLKKVKSGFYVKNKSKTDKISTDIVSPESMISEIRKIQAIKQKAIPDKNIDFSHELDKLIDKNSLNGLNEKINWTAKYNYNCDAVADENYKNNKIEVKIQSSNLDGLSKLEINKNGFGFEFNNTNSEKSLKKNRNSTKSNCNSYNENHIDINIDCAKSSANEDENSCNHVKKVKLKAEKNKVTFIEESSDPKSPTECEIFIHEEELEEGNN